MSISINKNREGYENIYNDGDDYGDEDYHEDDYEDHRKDLLDDLLELCWPVDGWRV